MKNWIIVAAICLIAGALVVHPQGPQHAKTARVVHADNGCDATSLNGNYSYSVQGFYFDNFGNLNVFSAAGYFVGDGQGNMSVKDTISIDGSITRSETYGGNYTVNSDCTGTMTTNSPTAGSLVYDFSFAGNNNDMMLVDADGGTNITGSAKRQTLLPSTPAVTSSTN
jgi:hypothetical protein